AARLVDDPHGRVRGVHALAAGPGRPVHLDLQVVRVDLHLDVLGRGQHGDGYGRGMDAATRFGDRNALHAVHAGLVLQLRVGPLAADLEHDLPEAAHVGRTRGQHLDLPAPALAVALV